MQCEKEERSELQPLFCLWPCRETAAKVNCPVLGQLWQVTAGRHRLATLHSAHTERSRDLPGGYVAFSCLAAMQPLASPY
jgi:hypothetical protein